MSHQYQEDVKYTSYPQGGDLSAASNLYRAVTINNSGQLGLATANSIPVGFIGQQPENGTVGTQVTVIHDAAKHAVVAHEAVAVGDLVNTEGAGRMGKAAARSGGGTQYIYGIAVTAARAADDVFIVQPIKSGLVA